MYFEEINGCVIGKTTDEIINNNLNYGFSTRIGGVSIYHLSSLNLGVGRGDDIDNVKENYRIFCSAIGIKADSVTVPKQIHSDIIVKVTQKDKGKRIFRNTDLPDCDGFITTDKNVALGIFYADCTPVLLYDNIKNVLCVLHCGWRGTVRGFAETGVITMINDYGCRPKNIHAVIGPCIGPCHFEVGGEVALEFRRASLEKCIKNGEKAEKYYIDLKKANREYLLFAGIEKDNITVSEECTVCNTHKYFSHRGCGENTGRMAMIAQLKK